MYPDALVWEGFHKATDSRNAGRLRWRGTEFEAAERWHGALQGLRS